MCVIGLGNPGKRYAQTRHNIGFHVIDKLAGVLHVRELSVHGSYELAEARHGEWTVLLCKPTTFMNRSGIAVLDLHREFGIDFSELLVVYDDVSLPLGSLRLRRRGSSGGHNGLSSIIQATDSENVARLRCGIDFSAPGSDLADYVLSPFDSEELPLAQAMTEKAAEAVVAVMTIGWDKAMNMYNTIQTNNQDSL